VETDCACTVVEQAVKSRDRHPARNHVERDIRLVPGLFVARGDSEFG
jgi:hypothetical protein